MIIVFHLYKNLLWCLDVSMSVLKTVTEISDVYTVHTVIWFLLVMSLSTLYAAGGRNYDHIHPYMDGHLLHLTSNINLYLSRERYMKVQSMQR